MAPTTKSIETQVGGKTIRRAYDGDGATPENFAERVSVAGSSIPTGAATNQPEHAEDAAHVSGDVGIEILGVRRDANTTPVSADGDYHTPVFDAFGFLKVQPGQAGLPFLSDTVGNQRVTIFGSGAGTGASVNNVNSDAVSINTPSVASQAFQMLFDGAAFQRRRTPLIFKTATATASGSTALWTPTSAKKFRVMKYRIEVTGQATIGAAGTLTIDLLDSATTMGLTHSLYLPMVAINTLGGFATGWIDLGNGKLSAAANNVLNINLDTALTAGVVRIIVAGTEE